MILLIATEASLFVVLTPIQLKSHLAGNRLGSVNFMCRTYCDKCDEGSVCNCAGNTKVTAAAPRVCVCVSSAADTCTCMYINCIVLRACVCACL